MHNIVTVNNYTNTNVLNGEYTTQSLNVQLTAITIRTKTLFVRFVEKSLSHASTVIWKL